ncbi:MAG: family 43 glycosylhydrolase, partial [Lachnospiraceae bacterium]|nr:family 43 glycosylhydrolase [Lachnospiraceae bacterium]
EFVIMIPGKKDRKILTDIFDLLRERMMEEAKYDKTFEIISLSLGILWNAKVSDGIDQLLSFSDATMYYAKLAGKNRYIFFDDYADRIQMESEMESTAEEAFSEGLFSVLYYPVLHLQNEMLLRTVAKVVWKNKRGTEWERSDYERVLSKSGFIKKLDIFAFERVCADHDMIAAASAGENMLGIEVSGIMSDDGAVKLLRKITDKYGLSVGDIELMVSESLFGKRNAEMVMKNIIQLREEGFSIAIKDFGRDFSSLRYMEKIKPDAIYYDKGYLSADYGDMGRTGILRTLFSFNRDMKLLSVGQGVKDLHEAEFLISNGCDGASGSFFMNPAPPHEYIKFISSLPHESRMTSYEFKKNLADQNGRNEGEIAGGGVVFCDGITDNWGALSFSGGMVETNLVKLPGNAFTDNGFTISMWLKPAEVQNWISAVFIKHERGFSSFMPSISGNLCMFRMHPNEVDDVWTDNMDNALQVGKWTHVALVYDAFSATNRIFINGKFLKLKSNIPNVGKPLFIYLGGDCYQPSFRGKISALKIWDAPLLEEEIQKEFDSYAKEDNYRGNDEPEEHVEYLTHDPAVFEDPENHKFYIYATGGVGMVSEDLVHWENLGKIISEVPAEAKNWTDSDMIWAPDIVKVNDEYRMYCSNSSWGVQQSCIFLAVSDNPAGPFRPKAVVLRTHSALPVNGIDANIIEDHETGEQYMVYGSFWGGVHMVALDKKTGLCKKEEIGICIAVRPQWTSGSIEGPYIIYHPETQYYYLFVSYGSLKNDYNIRVGRSRKVTGPYIDFFGNYMTDIDDEGLTRGLMICCGYRWLNGMPYMGPGHNSVLFRDNGDMFLVCHIRKMCFDEDDCGPGLLQVRRLFMTDSGWPIAAPEAY